MAVLTIDEYIKLAKNAPPNFKTEIQLTVTSLEETDRLIDSFRDTLAQTKGKLEAMIIELERRARYAIDHCPICSPKPGSPDLCPNCCMLQVGYTPGSPEQYEDYLKTR